MMYIDQTRSLSQWASHPTASSRLKSVQIKHTAVRKDNLQRPTEASLFTVIQIRQNYNVQICGQIS